MNNKFLSMIFTSLLVGCCIAESETTSTQDTHAQDSPTGSAREVLSKLKKKLRKTVLRKGSDKYEGAAQSPINLEKAFQLDLKDIQFHYQPSVFTIKNTGHSIQLASQDQEKKSYIIVDGTRYNLLQFHFHTPAEHTVDGKQSPMEAHFVHQNEEGNLAVIGVFINVGAVHQVYQTLFNSLPTKKGEEVKLQEPLDVYKLLPSDRRFFRYDGSLTTHPFTEGVKWIVIRETIELSQDQIDKLAQIYPKSARSVQKRNNRPVLFDSTSDT